MILSKFFEPRYAVLQPYVVHIHMHVAAMLAQGSKRVLLMIVALPVKRSPFRAFHWDGDSHHKQVP